MYYPFFITYMIVGFCITLCVFLWALKNGQFKDQQRARFLALQEGEERPPVNVSRLNRYQAYVLFGLFVSALGASAVVLVYALARAG
jgi:cbb3-type cytochrome oxidase maturation protein